MQQNSASVDCSTLIAEVPLQRDVELKPSACNQRCHLVAIDILETVHVDLVAFW